MGAKDNTDILKLLDEFGLISEIQAMLREIRNLLNGNGSCDPAEVLVTSFVYGFLAGRVPPMMVRRLMHFNITLMLA